LHRDADGLYILSEINVKKYCLGQSF
jgi:hypothetical protein